MSLLDHRHSSTRAAPSAAAGSPFLSRSALQFPAQAAPAPRNPLAPLKPSNIFALNGSLGTLSLSPHTQSSPDSVNCLKPLPSVPRDVNGDDSFDEAGVELVHALNPASSSDNEHHIESDISSASASSTASSSSMEPDWHETSLRKQVAQLSIQHKDVDLAQTEAPSVFGLRRRIIAAALDHATQRHCNDKEEGRRSSAQSQDKGMADWLAVQQSNSQWKDRILRKKLSFGKKQARAALAGQPPVHDPMPNDATSISTSSSRGRSNSTIGFASSQDKMLKRDKELAEREANFDLVVLSRFESASLNMTIYTEQRQGSWVVKGPAQPGANVLDEPPLVFSPWDCQIDSCAIVERKKLRSFVELSDTSCAICCSTCNSARHQQIGRRPDGFQITPGATVGCKQCAGSGAVQATYVVCITLRQSNFLPLAMPVRHLAGKSQNAFRTYLPRTTKAMSHVDVLRMRSLEAVRSCALRVGRAHRKEHDARLLMAKAVLERRTCNSVAVINRLNGLFKTFDITDGGCIRGGAGLTEEESRIVESYELTDALIRLPITTTVHPEGTYRFVDLEMLDMATSKEVRLLVPSRTPSVLSSQSSTDESYSPTAFSFFQRATEPARDRGETSRDSSSVCRPGDKGQAYTQAADGSRPPLHALNDSPRSAPSAFSTNSSMHSYISAPDRASITPNTSSLALPKRPWMAGRSTPSNRSSTQSGVSGRTIQTWETAPMEKQR